MTEPVSGDRSESDDAADDRTEPVDRAAAEVLTRARESADELIREAEREADESRLEAARLLEDARTQARTLLDESRIQRENALRALSEKRQRARSELAELRAGIDDLRRVHAEMARIVTEAGQVLDSVGSLDERDTSALGSESVDGVDVADGPLETDKPADDSAVDAPQPEDSAASGHPARVIDLQARRQHSERPAPTHAAGEQDLDTEDDHADPALEIDRAAEARRLADRREAFAVGRAPDPAGVIDGAVPLVSRRERQDIDQLFARVVDARQQVDAQAQETLRTLGPPTEVIEESDDPDLAAIQRRDRVVAVHGAEASLALKRVLADQLNEVLDGLRRVGPGAATVDGLLPEARDGEYVAAIREQVAAAASINPGITVQTESFVGDAAAELGGWLRRRISAFLAEPDRLEQRLRRLFREARRDRAETVGVHAVSRAFAAASLEAASGEAVRWLALTECTDGCAVNAEAGPVAAGSAFPSGHASAPVEHGCRCLVVPVPQ